MRTHKTKETFIARAKKEIIVINELLSFYKNVYLPTLEKFNGKVYNKRFINALNEQTTNELMLIRERENESVCIELRMERYNYTDTKQMYCMLKVNKDFRIDYNATINDELGNKWIGNLTNEINEINDVIANYDKYLSVAEECQKQIDKVAELPYQIRQNIAFDKIWYLK